MDQPNEWGAVGDESLVAAALDGSRPARAEIYQRYADRVHTMCVHMLSDRDEAADVCGQVFLVAFDRLGQLRDPSRLRPWIFSITRHEVYRRTRRRSRVELVGEVERMDHIMNTSGAHAGVDLEGDPAEDAAVAAELVAVVRAAADGLDDKDRMVLELQLQELGGDEMAEALGTSASTAYQHVHRMKERFERSLGALLIARSGRTECDELDELLADWDGQFSVLWRKRVARHVDRCEVCEGRRKMLPAALLGGGGAAAVLAGAGPAGASTEFPAPDSVRARVVDGAGPGPASGGLGGPVGRRTALVGAGAALVLLVVALLVATGAFGDDGDELVDASATTSTTLPASTSTSTSTTTTVAPSGDGGPAATTPVAPPPSTTVPPAASPPVPGDGAPAPDGGVAPPTTTVVPPRPPEAARPSVDLSTHPTTVYHPTPGFDSCGASTHFEASSPTATAMHLRWRTGAQSGRIDLVRVAVAGGGVRWRGVLELPAGVVGPVTVEAVGTAAGATGVSRSVTLPVEPCIEPG